MEKEERKNREILEKLLKIAREKKYDYLLLEGDIGENRWRGEEKEFILIVKKDSLITPKDVSEVYSYFLGDKEGVEPKDVLYFFSDGEEILRLEGLVENFKEFVFGLVFDLEYLQK